ncbi:MAG: hypothetical protein IKI35_05745 [Stomatobaculum sp.]|nr:hypothetical protein [Stomatobaculum sp.]MBR7058212.1 hypothetical protein [Stomatobaculum sp.]
MYDVKVVTSEIPVDCGPTCLKMLLDYYGVDVPLKTLIDECNTRIEGCTGKDLKRVGNAHGLDVRAYATDAETLLKMDRPSIAHWKHAHWVICCGTDNGQAVIVNPDRGKYHMPISAFKSFYSGTALFNGEPEESGDLPPTPEERIKQLEEELAAAKILLGVE